jgi:hypothetical protein
MQEKILKNSSENSSEDRSTPDFSQLAEIIKIWGKELGFQEVVLPMPMPTLTWRNASAACSNG